MFVPSEFYRELSKIIDKLEALYHDKSIDETIFRHELEEQASELTDLGFDVYRWKRKQLGEGETQPSEE